MTTKLNFLFFCKILNFWLSLLQSFSFITFDANFRAHRGLQQPERSRDQHVRGGAGFADGFAPGASAARLPADGVGHLLLRLLLRLLLPGRHQSPTGGGHLPDLQLAAAAAGDLHGRRLRDGHCALVRLRVVHFSDEKESGGRLGRAPRKRREAGLHLLKDLLLREYI